MHKIVIAIKRILPTVWGHWENICAMHQILFAAIILISLKGKGYFSCESTLPLFMANIYFKIKNLLS